MSTYNNIRTGVPFEISCRVQITAGQRVDQRITESHPPGQYLDMLYIVKPQDIIVITQGTITKISYKAR